MNAEDPSLQPRPAESAPPRPSLQDFLRDVLADQQRLDTPATRASEAYDAHATGPTNGATTAPAVFRDMIPLSKPKAGEQYAFEVDLDSCSGCKACVVACHSLNGLDDTEAWRDVGLLVSAETLAPWQQTVTSACHHCAEPGCLEGCPVLAYEKDPITGIVRHLDDQCIGCSYCVLKCPYDVPKYNARLGIVRKCDMCHQRLAVNEAPACVQACPTHAIRIVTVPVAAKTAANGDGLRVDTTHFLPAAPDPSYTQPTTRYVTKKEMPAAVRPADADSLREQPAHWPLVLMLTLTQAGLGLYATATAGTPPRFADFAEFIFYRIPTPNTPSIRIAIVGAAVFMAGLAASVLHLGQPLRAWRVFLGLRTSWLSREAVVFGGFVPLLAGALVFPQFLALKLAAVAVGLAGVACSAMLYIDTRRKFWSYLPTAVRFGGVTLVGALIFSAPVVAAIVMTAKLGYEISQTRGDSPSARLLRGPLLGALFMRFEIGIVGIVVLASGLPWLALVPWLLGEIVERMIYFRAVDAPKMPGVPSVS